MDEKRRFALALAGVGGCLCLASGIVFSGLGDVAAPSVGPPRAARVPAMPRHPMPSWVVQPRLEGRSPRSAPRALVMASAMERPAAPETVSESTPVAPAPEPGHQPLRPLATRRLAMPMLVGPAPDAAVGEVLVAQERTRSHGPVISALLTAGTHVGGSVKTVGRTLRRVF